MNICSVRSGSSGSWSYYWRFLPVSSRFTFS